MDLPGDLQMRLDKLLKERDAYSYKDDDLRKKVLVAFIAPTAVGKSTVIDRVLMQAAATGVNAGEVGTLTTRPGRANDPSNYRTDIPHEEMISLIEEKKVVNWSLFSTGHIYATNTESFPAEYNFLPLIPDSLAMLQRAGFKAVHAFYLTAPLDQWQEQLNARAEGTDNMMYRLMEANGSLKFSREHEEELSFIANEPGEEKLEELASRILDIVTRGEQNDTHSEAIHYRNQMHAYVKDFLYGNA